MTKRLSVMTWLRVELRMPEESRLDPDANFARRRGECMSRQEQRPFDDRRITLSLEKETQQVHRVHGYAFLNGSRDGFHRQINVGHSAEP